MHGWITTYSGKQFWPLDPNPSHVDINDIAHALARICRFGGHTDKFYSVAEHCCHMTDLVWSWFPKCNFLGKVLLHDASEAYLGDVVTPIKATMNDYKAAESILTETIFHALGVKTPTIFQASIIKSADEIMFITEYNQLFQNRPHEEPRLGSWKAWDKFDNGLYPAASELAEIMFLERYKRWVTSAQKTG